MRYYIKKISALIITLLLVSIVTFFAFQVISGDGAMSKLGMNASEEQIEAMREELGLNDSIFVRYFRFLKGAVTGNFGKSIQYDVPVADLMEQRLPVTLWLVLLSFVMILVVGVPLGLLLSKKEDGWLERFISLVTQTFMAVPSFFLGILITLLFGVILRWFQPGGYASALMNTTSMIQYLIFPALAVSIPKIAMVSKFVRTSVVRELKLDYVRTAKSKGQKPSAIMIHHVLKNAMIPVITFLGLILAEIAAGSIVIEQVFNLPGIGRLLLTGINNRDFPVVSAIVLYIAAVIVVINFLVDLLYQKADPRIRIR